MGGLSEEWKVRLGPAVAPFERTQFSRQVLDGEDILFVDYIIDTSRGTINPNTIQVDPALIMSADPPMQGKYLWVLTNQD